MNISNEYFVPGCDPDQFVSLFGLFVQGDLKGTLHVHKPEVKVYLDV